MNSKPACLLAQAPPSMKADHSALSRSRDRKPVFAFRTIVLHAHTGLAGKCQSVCACEHAQTLAAAFIVDKKKERKTIA